MRFCLEAICITADRALTKPRPQHRRGRLFSFAPAIWPQGVFIAREAELDYKTSRMTETIVPACCCAI
jgi:hypothetical protein